MNQKYTLMLAAALVTGTSAWAQVARMPQHARTTRASDIQHAKTHGLGEAKGGGAVLWSEDFANGIAGNNPSGAWSLDGPDGAIWHFGTTAPKGAYTPNSEKIQSTTVANGFAKFASDSANCTWVGNTPTALDPGSFTNWDGSLVSPVIDLSANPAAILEFQQRARYCCGDMPFNVEITTDGGNNWAIVPAFPNLATNALSATETYSVSLTPFIAADPSQAQFRFHHDGGTAQTSHYHWQVDDIQITVAPGTDGHVFDGFCSHRGDGTEFGRIPQSQLDQMNLGAFMDNVGATPLTNATITAVITDDATNSVQATASASTPSLVPGDTLAMSEWVDVSSLATGAYTVTFTGTSDESASEADTTNNSWVRTFEVTTSGEGMTYSLDELGGHPAGTEQTDYIGTDQFTGGADDFWAFTYYPITADLEVDAIELELSPGSVAGGLLRVSIHDSTNIVADDPTAALIESDDYVLTTANIASGTVSVPLPTAYTLSPGAYYAGVIMYSNANQNDFGVVDDITIPQPGISSAIFIDQLFSNGIALAIRLRNTNVGMNENALKGVGIYPNPTNGLLHVTFQELGNYNVEVMNSLGEVVSTARMNGTSTIDLSSFAKGVYSVRVSSNEAAMVQRVVLN